MGIDSRSSPDDAGADLPFRILPTDTRFAESYDAGDPRCLCSRCGKPIPETTIPIRAWPSDGRYEYRFHPECLGFVTTAPLDDDDLFYLHEE